MCTSKPRVPAAPTMPTVMSPEIIDQAALDSKSRERRRQAAKYGRQSTILGGMTTGGAGMPPTAGQKTALGQ